MIRVYRNGWKQTVGIIITIQNGSFFETKEQEGYTHIAEHMMFSGTKELDRYALRDKFETIFHNLEATTSKEEVNIFCYVDKEDLNMAMQILHDMVFNWNCRSDIFEDEKKDLLNEMNIYFKSREYKIRKAMYNVLPFPKQEILGTVSGIKKLAYRDLHRIKRYWDTFLKKSSIDILFLGNGISKKMLLATHTFFLQKKSMPSRPVAWKKLGTDLIERRKDHLLQIHCSTRHPYLLFLGEIYYQRWYISAKKFDYQAAQFSRMTTYFVSNLNDKEARSFFFDQISVSEFNQMKAIFLKHFRQTLDGIDPIDSLKWLQGFRFSRYGNLPSDNPEDIYNLFKRMSYRQFCSFVTKNIFSIKMLSPHAVRR